MFDACFDPCGLLAIIDRRLQELCELRDKKTVNFSHVDELDHFCQKESELPTPDELNFSSK
jgi:hypothetical protein